MTQYTDYTFYTGQYGGELTEEQFRRVIVPVSAHIRRKCSMPPVRAVTFCTQTRQRKQNTRAGRSHQKTQTAILFRMCRNRAAKPPRRYWRARSTRRRRCTWNRPAC